MALCNITGIVYLPSGAIAANRDLIFRRTVNKITPEYLGVVFPDDVFTTTDDAGAVDVDLITGSYSVVASGKPRSYVGTVNVPDAPSATFAEVLLLPSPGTDPAWYTDLVDGLADESTARQAEDTKLRGGIQQGAVVSLVNQASTVTAGNTLITADIAPASVTAGLVIQPGVKILLVLPATLTGNISLQVTGDTVRTVYLEQNTVQASASDLTPGATLILRLFSGRWVIQSGAVVTSTIHAIEDKIELTGTPVDGFDGANTEGFLAKGTGAISSASASWSYTDLIPASAGQVFKYVGSVNRDLGAAIAYYDVAGNYLIDALVANPSGDGPIQAVTGTVTVPSGVGFVRSASLNTAAHSLTYINSASAPEDFDNEVVTVMESAAGTEKLRLQAAISALLNGSAMPSTLANLPGIGDSFTVGANATTAANRFLNRVAVALGATVTNYGIGGTVLQNSNGAGGVPLNNNGRDRFRGLFTGTAKKDFALIAYGFNDARYTAAPTTFNVAAYKSDYREVMAGLMCEGYRRDQILIVGPHYITDVGLTTGSTGFSGQTRAGFEAYVTAAQEVATEFGVLYFDSYAYMRDNGGDTLIDTDDIHPTNEGHQVIATGILQETTVLNQRDTTTVTRFDDVLSWSPVVGAAGYEVVFVNYDSLIIGTPTEVSSTSVNVPALGIKAIALVRPIFSAGVYGPQASSKPRNI